MGRRLDYVSNFMEAMRGGPPIPEPAPPPQQTPEQVRFQVKQERVEAYLTWLREQCGDPENPFDRTNLRQWTGDESAFQLAASLSALLVLGEHQPYMGIWARGCRVCHSKERMQASVGMPIFTDDHFPCHTVRDIVDPYIAILEAKGLDQ